MSTHPLKIRILLADDHTVVRRGIRMVLESAPDLDVVAEASDGIASSGRCGRTSTWRSSTSRCRAAPACKRHASCTDDAQRYAS